MFFNGAGDPGNYCPTADGTGLRHTEGMEAVQLFDLHRVSFTPTAAGSNFYGASVHASTTSTQVTISVSDTTMYNPRWSTYANFTTQWGFQNTTGQAINVALVATGTTNGAFTGTLNFAVPANSQVFKSSAVTGNGTPDLATPVVNSGFAVVTSDGPPGGLLVDAYFVNGTVVVPAVFQPVRALQH